MKTDLQYFKITLKKDFQVLDFPLQFPRHCFASGAVYVVGVVVVVVVGAAAAAAAAAAVVVVFCWWTTGEAYPVFHPLLFMCIY